VTACVSAKLRSYNLL